MRQKVIGRHDISEEQSLRSVSKWVLIFVIASMIIGTYVTIGTAMVILPFILGLPVAVTLFLNIQYLRAK